MRSSESRKYVLPYATVQPLRKPLTIIRGPAAKTRQQRVDLNVMDKRMSEAVGRARGSVPWRREPSTAQGCSVLLMPAGMTGRSPCNFDGRPAFDMLDKCVSERDEHEIRTRKQIATL